MKRAFARAVVALSLSWPGLVHGQAQAPAPGGNLIQVRPPAAPPGAAARTLAQRAGDVHQGADHGIVCDGASDIGPALQALHDRLRRSMSALVQLPPGRCLINTAVTINRALRIEGHGPGEMGQGRDLDHGTMLYTTNPAITPINVVGLAAAGTSIGHLSFGQRHPAPVAGQAWTPTNYAPFFRIESASGVKLHDLYGHGISRGIISNSSGRLTLDKLWGQFFDYAVFADNSLDVDHYSNLHVWPFWSVADPVMAYTQANLDAIRLARVDNPSILDLFVFAARSGIRIDQSSGGIGGTVGKLKLANADLDYVRWGVWVRGRAASLMATNLAHQGSVWPPNGIVPIPDAAVLRVEQGGSVQAQFGSVQSDVSDRNVFALLSTTDRSEVDVGSLVVKSTLGGAGSAVVRAEIVNNPGLPHSVSVAAPPRLAPSGPLPILNEGTNAVLDVPGQDYAVVYGITPGATYKVPNSARLLMLEPAVDGVIPSLTVAMPDFAVEGREVAVVVTKDVTALTVSAGEPVISAPTSLREGVGFVMKRTRQPGQGGVAWVRIR